MSSFLCFICHSTVNSDTNEDTREKYRDVVGMNLCPDSHLCYICCHVLNKLSLFKSVCLKRSLEYPVLFSEKGTLNLQRNNLEIHTLCPEDFCGQYHHRNIFKSYHSLFNSFQYESHNECSIDNHYVELAHERYELKDCFNVNEVIEAIQPILFDTKCTQTDCHEKVTFESYVQTDDLVNDSKGDADDNDEEMVCNDDEFDNCSVRSESVDDGGGSDEIINDTDINNDGDDVQVDNDVENSDNESLQEDNEEKESKSHFKKTVLSLEEQKADLEAKRREKKYTEAEFKCYNCALGFLFKDTYQAHMMRHEESNGEHRCVTCTLRFASPAVLRSHTSLHAARYWCSRCGACVLPARRRTHADACWRVRPPAACHMCPLVFSNTNALQQHVKRYHESKTSRKTYSCNVCGDRYKNQAAVRTHMIKHLNRKFTCDQCPSTFSSPYTLRQHKKRHDTKETELHKCESCGATYGSKKSLRAHWRREAHHQQIVSCEICHRPCLQRSLPAHIQRMHSSTEHHCHKCPKSYSSRKSLLRHLKQHEGQYQARTAVCHLCGASFKGNYKLKRHLKAVCEKSKLDEELNDLYQHE